MPRWIVVLAALAAAAAAPAVAQDRQSHHRRIGRLNGHSSTAGVLRRYTRHIRRAADALPPGTTRPGTRSFINPRKL